MLIGKKRIISFGMTLAGDKKNKKLKTGYEIRKDCPVV
jgi:hypothetical protein